jgi:intracellular septation protein
VNFKVFGVTPLTMLFALTQMPLIKRYQVEPVSLEESEAEAGDVSKG